MTDAPQGLRARYEQLREEVAAHNRAYYELDAPTIPDDEYPKFLRELESIRGNGFAANFEGTEDGVSALGMALHNRHGQVVGALSVATPATRFRAVFDAGLVPALKECCRQLEIDIVANPAEPD